MYGEDGNVENRDQGTGASLQLSDLSFQPSAFCDQLPAISAALKGHDFNRAVTEATPRQICHPARPKRSEGSRRTCVCSSLFARNRKMRKQQRFQAVESGDFAGSRPTNGGGHDFGLRNLGGGRTQWGWNVGL
jgi:hypothetical protein